MTTRLMRCIVSLILFSSAAAGVNAQSLDQYLYYLPESGVINGEVMVPGASPELEALAQRIRAAAAENPQWFETHVEKAGSGKMPYHENLGVSEEEYERFTSLVESGVSLQLLRTG